MKRTIRLFATIWLCSIFTVSAATAADWYARLASGVEWSDEAVFRDESSPNFFGATTGNDGRQIGSYGDFGTSFSLESAVGLRLLPWLRSEFSLTYRPNMEYAGQANFAGVSGPQPVSGRAGSISGLTNLFFDFHGLPGVALGRFQPYVGGGVGFSVNHLDAMTYRFPGLTSHTYSITPAGDRTDLAFMLTAGTGFELTRRVILDLSYRYTDLGRVQTDSGVMLRNGSVSSEPMGGTSAPLRTHGMLMGVRYLF